MASAKTIKWRWKWADWLHVAFFCLLLGSAFVSQSPFYLHGLPASRLARWFVDRPPFWAILWLIPVVANAGKPMAATMLRFLRFTSVSIAGALVALFLSAVAGSTPAVEQAPATGVVLWISFLSERQFTWLVMTAIGSIAVLHILRLIESFGREVALRREAQDVALRAKLAPHFIFNTLNTLKAQIEIDPGGASTTADRLAALFRQVLERTDRATIPLREELGFVESYLGIERVRLGDRLRVVVDIPEEVESAEVPPMALQALVENAVVHGVAPRPEGGEVRIQARWDGTGTYRKLVVRVDNPVAPGATPGTGTGLAVLRGRLFRPEDLRTEERDGWFRAEFVWRGANP